MNIKIRPATNDDCFDLWLWRNHPKVREMTFNSKEIDYTTHIKWFSQKIKDENVRIYIADSEEGEKLGQVRFEVDKECRSLISINLNPDFFGKGLGNKIIKKATDFFLEEKTDVKEIIAEIIEENTVSKKAFEKAGYLIAGGGEKKNRKMIIMSYRKEKD